MLRTDVSTTQNNENNPICLVFISEFYISLLSENK